MKANYAHSKVADTAIAVENDIKKKNKVLNQTDAFSLSFTFSKLQLITPRPRTKVPLPSYQSKKKIILNDWINFYELVDRFYI